MCTGRRIANSEHRADIFLEAIPSGLFQDRPQRSLQSDSIGRLLAYGDVGLQTVKRATPVSTTPGGRLIHAPFSAARQSLRHGIAVFRPDVGDVPVAELRPRDALDI